MEEEEEEEEEEEKQDQSLLLEGGQQVEEGEPEPPQVRRFPHFFIICPCLSQCLRFLLLSSEHGRHGLLIT
jgi:hypothetical protein